MKIKYIGHSGFSVEHETIVLIIDCCGCTKENLESYKLDNKYLYILSSHAHGDHFDPNILTFGGGKRKWIFSADIKEKVPENCDIHFIAKGESYKDERLKVKAYGSTDEGVSFYIELGGFKIFHAGDLNNWHWKEEETPKDAAKNEQFFLDELSIIAGEVPSLDALMFPVDPRLGKDYDLGAEQFLDSIKVNLFIPMHFWNDFEKARAFKIKAEKRGCRFADIRTAGDEFILE